LQHDQFFKDKVCVITGASRGIGAALARELGQRGARLALFARSEPEIDALVEEMGHADVDAIALIGDVTINSDVKRLAQETAKHYGAIDIVVANAGIGVQSMFSDLSMEDIRWVMEVNFFGVVSTIQATLPHLRKRPESRLGIVSSLAGKLSLPAGSAYSASKFALQGLGAALRAEEEALGGPKVTLLCPGFVESNISNASVVRGDGGRSRPPKMIVVPAHLAAKEIADALIEAPPEVMITGHAKIIESIRRIAPNFVNQQAARQLLKKFKK
jgi:dehydrogenase/reductase SDR family member 7B